MLDDVILNGLTVSWWIPPTDCSEWLHFNLDRSSEWNATGSVIGPVWLNIFVSYLNEGDEETLANFANDTKVGGMTNTVDKKKIWKDLDKSAVAARNRIEFNRKTCKVLH